MANCGRRHTFDHISDRRKTHTLGAVVHCSGTVYHCSTTVLPLLATAPLGSSSATVLLLAEITEYLGIF
jgi:hypothetical protein